MFHHQPELAPKAYSCATRTVNLADKLSAAMSNPHKAHKLEELRNELNYYFDLNGNAVTTIIENTTKMSIEVLSLLDISSSDLEKSSIQLLQEANSALCDISLSTSKMVLQYKQQKEQAQRASAALSSANAELSRLAFQDSLTGLYNLRYFHDYMDRELQRASRYDTTFSFLMFDIDDFKLINDIHGHQAGDIMLERIAQVTLTTMRNTDLVARYGGEEFAVILPETTLDVAAQIAERLRENIAKLSVDWNGQQLHVTASIGVSYFNSQRANLSKNQIIAIADAGLYRAKNEGKNRVHLPLD
jgi:diguanylate cyclase (GGDEF)-like protein